MTVADLLTKLGGVPAERVRLEPLPGTATEEDLLAIQRREKRNCELIDGVLVEKTVGLPEAVLAGWMVTLLYRFLGHSDLGILAGASGPFRLMPGLIRMPTISFISWDQLPKRRIPTKPIVNFPPDLAVEILIAGNTKAEMERKLREYFLAGTRLVWLVNPRKRTVRVYTASDQSRLLKEDQSLDGGEVLPGLRLALGEIFAKLGRRPARRKRNER